MPKGRVRATFLLQLVVLAASVALFGLVFVAATSVAAHIGTLILLVVLWFVGIEGGVVPAVIERLVTSRARQGAGPARSAWFVDVDAEHRSRMDRLREETRDNSSLQ